MPDDIYEINPTVYGDSNPRMLTAYEWDGTTAKKLTAYEPGFDDPDVPVNPQDPPPVTNTKALYVGAAIGGNDNPSALETSMGGVKIMSSRQYFGASSNTTTMINFCKNAWANGRLPMPSTKPPGASSAEIAGNWAAMGNGTYDTLITGWCADMQAAAVAYGPNARVNWMCHHEPDDEIIAGYATAANFAAMATRCADIAANYNRIDFGVTLMGFHTWGPAPDLDINKIVPPALALKLKWFGIDVYEHYKVDKTTWTPFEKLYYAPVKKWVDSVNPNMKWGQMETGIAAAAFDEDPLWFSKQDTLLKKYGASFFTYFDSGLNSIASWPLEGPRLQGFKDMLIANRDQSSTPDPAPPANV